MSKYTKYHSNYILRKKHQNTNKGPIYERDWVTIGNRNTVGAGKTLYYTDGNFVFTRNNVESYPNKHKLSTSENVWRYEDVQKSSDSSSKIKILEKCNDIRDYVYYGSCVDLITSSIENIISQFPGAIFTTEQRLEIPPKEADGDFISLENEFLIDNPFGIDLYHDSLSVVDVDNPLRWLTITKDDYTINGQDINTYVISTYFDENYCLENEQWDYRYWNNNKMSHIIEITINGTFILKGYRIEDDIVFTTNTDNMIIKPKEEIIEAYFNGLDGFEKILLNRNTKPLYTNYFITPVEGKLSYYYVSKTYTWPSVDYCIDIDSSNYEEFIDKIYKLGTMLDELWTDNIYRNMTHEAIKNFDWTYTKEYDDDVTEENIQGGERMKSILHYCGRVFDNIKRYADGIKSTNRITYDGNSNLPSSELTEQTDKDGWDTASIIPFIKGQDVNAVTIDNDFLNSQNIKWFPNEVPSVRNITDFDNDFIRRLHLSSKYIFKNKGTLNSIRMILALFGLDEGKTDANAVSMKEYLYKIENINKETTKRIQELNSRRDITINYDEDDPYWGIPIKEMTFSDGNFAVPYFTTNDKEGFYFQSKGGWGKYIDDDFDKVTLNSIDYNETLSYLRMCTNVQSLFDIRQNDIKEKDICYVFDLSDYVDVTGDEDIYVYDEDNKIVGKKISHFFVAETDGFKFSWKNVKKGTNDEIAQKAKYLEDIVTKLTGNNPHVGYGNYDCGIDFIENMVCPFKNIKRISSEGLSDQELDERIFTYKTVVTKTPDDKIKKLFKTNKAEDGYYINSKILVLKNNIGADNKLYKDYFRQTILPYIMQVTPSTTILILEKF